jgi:hypothetical protein
MPGEAMPNPDLESMALLLEKSGDYKVLWRYSKTDRYHADVGGAKEIGVFLDVDTKAAADILRRHLKLSAAEAMLAVQRALERIYVCSCASLLRQVYRDPRLVSW